MLSCPETDSIPASVHYFPTFPETQLRPLAKPNRPAFFAYAGRAPELSPVRLLPQMSDLLNP